jgi:hypothetical protein
VFPSQLIAKRLAKPLMPLISAYSAVWREGVQVLKVEGVKERWIDLSEVAKWARQNRLNSRAA